MINKNIQNILLNSANLKSQENCLILYCNKTYEIAIKFKNVLIKYTDNFKLLKLNVKNHGSQVSIKTKKEILNYDLVICLTWYSLAHSKARFDFSKIGGRFLSLPQYDLKVLKSKACSVTFKDYIKESEALAKLLTNGKKCLIITKNRYKLYLDLSNRIANAANCFLKKGELGSPPDIEVNIAPNEQKSNGVIEIYGSIAHEKIGKLKSPIFLEILNGKIVKITSNDYRMNSILKKLKKLFNEDKKKILGELGFGLNNFAKLSGNMLLDEGSRGVVHLGFGSNYTIGGKNIVNFHLDLMIKKSVIYIDDNIVLKNGNYVF